MINQFLEEQQQEHVKSTLNQCSHAAELDFKIKTEREKIWKKLKKY